MDIVYAVKQLDREIEIATGQLAEKKATRAKLFAALNPQEQAIINAQADEAKKPDKPK
jgi:hypothetical protein